MSPIIRHLLSFLLLTAFATSGHSQSLESEQAKLAQLKQQNKTLLAENTVKQAQLSDVSTELENLKQNNPPSTELESAAALLASAKAKSEQNPTSTNIDKLEMAQFKHALAYRKHSKSNPDLSRLKREQTELQKTIAANEQKINDNKALISSQTALVETLRVDKEKAAQAWRLKQQQQKSKNEQVLLQQAEQERTDALAEVKRLRALLASQAAATAPPVEATPVKVAALKETPVAKTPTSLESFVFLLSDEEIAAEKNRISSALSPNTIRAGSKFSRFLTIKSYNTDDPDDKKTKRLDHIGNAIYQRSGVTITVEETILVVGQKEWRVNLPALDTGIPAGQVSSYTVTLDLRNEKLPFLTIYPD